MKILLVDDHVLFREGLTSLLDAQPDMTVVGQAASMVEAIVKARKLKPDTILMDISMPDGNGIEAARQILAQQPEIDIVFLTVHEDDERLFEAIASGGKGYLPKNTRTAELLKMLRGLAQGEAALSRRLTPRILAEFARMKTHLADVEPLAEEVVLTKREMDVLKLAGTGASNKEIAEQLAITESTIKNHMRHILSKLHLKNRREAVSFARRRGLIPPFQN